jgi:hypothetical protein
VPRSTILLHGGLPPPPPSRPSCRCLPRRSKTRATPEWAHRCRGGSTHGTHHTGSALHSWNGRHRGNNNRRHIGHCTRETGGLVDSQNGRGGRCLEWAMWNLKIIKIDKNVSLDRTRHCIYTYNKNKQRHVRIHSTVNVIRTCIFIMLSVLEVTDRVPPTCITNTSRTGQAIVPWTAGARAGITAQQRSAAVSASGARDGRVAVAPMARGTWHGADTALWTVVPGMARTTASTVRQTRGDTVPAKSKTSNKRSVSLDHTRPCSQPYQKKIIIEFSQKKTITEKDGS